MTNESLLREKICLLAKSMFDCGLTDGSTGNISARTENGGQLVSPTGTSFGRLDPSTLCRFDATVSLIRGDKPTKEMPLHAAFYDTPQHNRCSSSSAFMSFRGAVNDAGCGQFFATTNTLRDHETRPRQVAALLLARRP